MSPSFVWANQLWWAENHWALYSAERDEPEVAPEYSVPIMAAQQRGWNPQLQPTQNDKLKNALVMQPLPLNSDLVLPVDSFKLDSFFRIVQVILHCGFRECFEICSNFAGF